MKTKSNKFKNGDELIALWREYCYEIADNGFAQVPTQTAFCRWLEKKHNNPTDRKTIYNSLYKIFPEIKKEFDSIRGDIIAQGAMCGKYQPTMSIFALKHWCAWSDLAQDVSSKEVRIIDDI